MLIKINILNIEFHRLIMTLDWVILIQIENKTDKFQSLTSL